MPGGLRSGMLPMPNSAAFPQLPPGDERLDFLENLLRVAERLAARGIVNEHAVPAWIIRPKRMNSCCRSHWTLSLFSVALRPEEAAIGLTRQAGKVRQ